VTVENPSNVKTASTASEREIAKAESAKAMQGEFGFQGEPVENRGSFDKSDRNLFEGQDLDVPTYLRKGIKITV
jgi:cell division protein FtsZ